MKNILVVDDQPCVREVISEELDSEGYRVTTARDTESVTAHLRVSPPDLVVLDLFLDGLEGIALLHEIKLRYPWIPVIVFTAYESFREDPRLSKADAYVVKSSLFDELKESIMLLLNRAPRSAPTTGFVPHHAHLQAGHAS